MVTIREMLESSPAVAAIRTRANFATVATVTMERWWLLDTASSWCEQRWRDQGRPYRRRISASERTASFDFASSVDALAFALRFGTPLPGHLRRKQ